MLAVKSNKHATTHIITESRYRIRDQGKERISLERENIIDGYGWTEVGVNKIGRSNK